MTRIIIADDHTLFRAGLKQMLTSLTNLIVVAETANAEQTLRAVTEIDADLLICDLTMPGTSGTQLIESIRRTSPKLPILVLSMHDEPTTIRRAIQAGATGYLTKEASPEVLHEAVITVASGQQFLPAELAKTLAFDPVRVTRRAHDSLSQRESEVFRLITQGQALAQIAEQLHLSPKTITTHKTHLMEKLGVENNAELIRYAIEHKLFD